MSITFLVTSMVIVALPGTGALLTISAGLVRGTRASIVTAVGCTLGIVPHLAAAMTGTATLLRDSGAAFESLKVLGIIYLVYMACSTWRDATPLELDAVPPRSPSQAISSAILANLLNPKLTIFFFAFLPQFIPQHSPNQVTDMLILSGVFMAMTFVVFVLYGALAASVRHHLIDRPHVVTHIRKCFAVSFVALSAKLAATSR